LDFNSKTTFISTEKAAFRPPSPFQLEDMAAVGYYQARLLQKSKKSPLQVLGFDGEFAAYLTEEPKGF